ncbi:MAG: hypothetical protein ABI862_19715 [Ilumatobacteraceae bacterium]
MSRALATINSATLEQASLTEVLAWCDQGRTALERAIKLTDATNLLGVASTLDYVVRMRDMNEQAVIAASKLRIMAERRVGELIASERKAGKLDSRGGDRVRRQTNLDGNEVGRESISLIAAETDPSTLADHGITYDEASAYAKLAAVPSDQFDAVLDECAAEAIKKRGCITRASVLRTINPEAEKRPDERALDFERFVDSCERAHQRAGVALTAIRFGNITRDHPWPEALVNTSRRILTALATDVAAILKELSDE